jgi:hypothetical protein
MARATVSLADMGFDLISVQAAPVLSAIASQADLDRMIAGMSTKTPGVSYDLNTVKARACFLDRLPAQRDRVDARLRLWAKREVDCLALKPFDTMFEKIYMEMKVPHIPHRLD